MSHSPITLCGIPFRTLLILTSLDTKGVDHAYGVGESPNIWTSTNGRRKHDHCCGSAYCRWNQARAQFTGITMLVPAMSKAAMVGVSTGAPASAASGMSFGMGPFYNEWDIGYHPAEARLLLPLTTGVAMEAAVVAGIPQVEVEMVTALAASPGVSLRAVHPVAVLLGGGGPPGGPPGGFPSTTTCSLMTVKVETDEDQGPADTRGSRYKKVKEADSLTFPKLPTSATAYPAWFNAVWTLS